MSTETTERKPGFDVEHKGEPGIATGNNLTEYVMDAARQLVPVMIESGGGAVELEHECRSGHIHRIRVTVADITDEEFCDTCAGTGIKGSREESSGPADQTT